MAWHSITLTLANPSDAEAVEQHLTDLGAVAVTYTDAGDEPILEPELNTQPLWPETNLTALFDLETDMSVVKLALLNEFGHERFSVADQSQVDDKQWEREWLAHFKPMRFGQRLWICPEAMELPKSKQSDKNVIIKMDPGLAFGTGTHETTSLCLTWLDGAELKQKSILDYGCGSGILAIAALKLGAKKATCLDIDQQAISATLNNAKRNKLTKKLSAYLPDDPNWPSDETYDVILANILATPLIALAQDMRRRLEPGGKIVLSGILLKQADQVHAAYAPYFHLDETRQDGDWVCLTGTLKTPSEMLLAHERITHCPNCEESFYINADDLDRANGKVCCGECHTVFFALDFIDFETGKQHSNLANSIDSGAIPKAHQFTGLWNIGTNTMHALDQEMQAKSHDHSADPLMDIQIPGAAQMHALDEVTPLDLNELDDLKNPKLPKWNWLWLVIAILALLTLAAQYIHQHRNQLALHPSLGQPLQSLYAKLPLELEPNWNLDAYMITASTISLNPEGADELIASFNLSNTAKHAQVFPLIRLSLFNRWGERIAFRDLEQEDYLPAPAANDAENNAKRDMLAAQGRVDAHVAVKDPGPEAKDFNFEVCLNKTGTIRCQSKL